MFANTTMNPFSTILPGMEIRCTKDSNDNLFGWVRLDSADALTESGTQLAAAGARLCTITAYNENKFDADSDMELVYNFDLDGAVLTLSLPVTADSGSIPSLIGLFANADWHEREFAELFDIQLTGRPAPKPLFLDPSIEPGIFNRLIPLSSMMNGASTKQLWETIFAATSMPDWAKEAK